MRIEGTGRIGSGAGAARRVQSGTGFSLPEEQSSAPTARPAGLVPTPGLDALLALQSVDMPVERRKKAASRGRQMLDLLDTIKLGVLDGSLSPSTLESLGLALSTREPSEDAGLESILDEIELRAQVELAKLSRRPV